ncbi:hypothetical protein ACM66B_004397 [Microbotryomycetes sp. NB124-2]
MHGFIDSFPVPVHPPQSWTNSSAAGPSTATKGKQKQSITQDTSNYDVVANWTTQERSSVEHRIEMAARLGYSTVVLVINITPTTNPSTLVFPTPLMPQLDPRTASSTKDHKQPSVGLVLQLWRIHVSEYSDSHIKSASVKGQYGFSNSTASLFPPQTTLLSVSPTSVTSFSHVCLSLSTPSPYSPTVISIDPSVNTRLPFPLKRGLVSTLLRSGMCIEIVYRGIVKQDESQSSVGGVTTAATRRRNWISGAREIVRALGGTNIIVSSGAENSHEMRASQDLINLCTLIGLTPVQAKNALTSTPRDAIMRGLAMRQTHKGVISNPSLVVTTTSAQGLKGSIGGTSKKRSVEVNNEANANEQQQQQTISSSSSSKKRKM